MTFDAIVNGYYYIYSHDMAAPLIAGYRYVSSKQIDGLWHHAYRQGREARK